MKTTYASACALLLLATPLQAKHHPWRHGGPHEIFGHPVGSVPASSVNASTISTSISSSTTLSASSTTQTSVVAASSSIVPPAQTPSPVAATSSVSAAAPASKITPAAKAVAAPEAGAGGMTIEIINSWTAPISVSFGNNAGGPCAIGTPTAGPLPSSTAYAFPTGWAGRIYIGPGPDIDPNGSKIEGSTTGSPDIDVSYVDGYSVPIVCSSNGVPVTGCNVDLFAQPGITCADKVAGPVCHNPMQGVPNGPAAPFFAACAGAAYTYPNDNDANDGDTATTVSCCIGTGCAAPARQGKAQTKRTIAEGKLGGEEVKRTTEGRKHRKGRHGGHSGEKKDAKE